LRKTNKNAPTNQKANIGYNKTLISNANAHLNLGDVCLLIGNNGVGKTTLIKSILHQIPLLSGEILSIIKM
jgi:iron complex transport system ATP-binding protein